MKMWKRMMVLISLCCLFWRSSVSAEELDAVSYVQTLCSGDAESLTLQYPHTEELLDALKPAGGMKGLQNSLKGLGELQSAGTPIITEAGGYTSYSVPCVFAMQKLNLVLNVDAEGRIGGIVTALYMEGTDPEEASVSAGEENMPVDEGSASAEEDGMMPEGIEEVELNLPVVGSENWELPGILTLPEGEGPFPAVVLVHGSGPNDKDETLGPNRLFRDLAWGLAQQGIAVYRYDKRTYVYGQELAQDTSLTLLEETVLDAVQAVELLKKQESIEASFIYAAGHSLGGMAIPRIHETLQEETDAAGYIFLAAPARSLPELMREQYEFLYAMTPELSEAEQQQKELIFAELDRLADVDALADADAVLGAYGTYWKDLSAYHQTEAAAAITQPCLVLQGEEDYQVTMEEFGLWKDAFGEAENWNFQSYPGLTHLFMEGQKENGPADYQVKRTADAQVIADMAAFVLEQK